MFEIGNSLREARMRRELDFPELEQGTKIRAKYLRALEDEQFETLPTATYVKGFLRTYANYLGLDGQLYVDEYNLRYGSGAEVLERTVRGSDSTRRPRQQPAAAARIERRLVRAGRNRSRHRARDRRLALRRKRWPVAPAEQPCDDPRPPERRAACSSRPSAATRF